MHCSFGSKVCQDSGQNLVQFSSILFCLDNEIPRSEGSRKKFIILALKQKIIELKHFIEYTLKSRGP